jgi:putative endopeptidase
MAAQAAHIANACAAISRDDYPPAMKRVLTFASAVVLLLSACSHPAEHVPKPKYGTWGFDTADMDTTVRPGDDFFHYALGSWAKTAQIKPDNTYVGMEQVLNDELDGNLKALVERAAAANAPRGEVAQKVGDFYTAFIDQPTADARGVEPIRGDLAAIDAATDKTGLAPALAALNMADALNPFPVTVSIDPRNSTRYVAQIWQGGLAFGERDYYLNPTFSDLRTKFAAHVENVLKLAGYSDAHQQAQEVLALETKLAEVQWPLEKARDQSQTSTIMSRSDVEKLGAGAPLAAVFDAQRLPANVDFQVGMPDVLTKTAQLFATEPLEAWRAYLRYKLIAHYGDILSKPFVDENFEFYSRDLNGIEQNNPRWQLAIWQVSDALGDAVGQLYVAEHFSAETRSQVLALVENIRKAYAAGIDSAGWMAPETKKQAQEKLAALVPKIGYPDNWRNYDSVTSSAHDLVGNVKSAEAWAWNDQIRRLGQPVDRAEWTTTPQTVNAYYDFQLNDIVFPAAILQAPYFDPAADAAANYGSIGAVIGHEISHGFDDQGRKTDSTGTLRDWWTTADAQRYDQQAAKLTAQFDAYEPVPGLHVNGAQTLGENIADLAGLRIAYDAYKLSLGGKEAPVIDGLTGDQRFFLAYASHWKAIYRPETMRDILLTDEHSPVEDRVNGIVRNIDEWYTAFDVKHGDKLYLPPGERVRVW